MIREIKKPEWAVWGGVSERTCVWVGEESESPALPVMSGVHADAPVEFEFSRTIAEAAGAIGLDFDLLLDAIDVGRGGEHHSLFASDRSSANAGGHHPSSF